LSKTDSLDLFCLIERHPEAQQKIGVGIDHFEVMKTTQGTTCFSLVRTDGSGTDFSFYSCITGKAPSRKQEVSEALRKVVEIDIYKARDKFFKEHARADGLYECAKTKERIKREDGHIDHLAPLTFEVLVANFVAAHGLSYEQIPISRGQDNQTFAVILDTDLAEKFRAFHNSVATLDFVKSEVNLGQASKNRIKTGRLSQ
jgi:hypothetical protein